ncbi:MAG: hypothetical protein HRU18_06580 [Pseudoalteromonas sp.]|uniref:hypothetical protein n=1 Tax=Pseudoalteromonas sp. TaxID=53249 RepID=UPI001DB15FE6|nr:hypothetical protein [Pseudoalteromonas sp.]NRA77855.1 hypothetical protein [Pseudoalteromonas sp.]
MANKLPKNPNIARKVREGIKGGVSVSQIFKSISHMKNAPKSYTGFYRLYREDMEEVKFEIDSKVGKTVIDQALDGDFKSQELYLRSRAGWSPSSHVQEQEVGTEDEETEGVINALMAALGKETDEED